jgi:acyl carrier protein
MAARRVADDRQLARDIEEYLLLEIERLFGEEREITRATRLDELGLDSLRLVELDQIIEERFGVTRTFLRGPLTDVLAGRTLGDLIDSLYWEEQSWAGAEAPQQLDALRKLGRLRWTGSTPPLPRTVKLSGSGPSAADYVIEGRR